jgi:hypothetical protein
MNQPTVTTVVVTIASGASLSDAAFTGGLPVCGVQMPAGWDAADLTFQAAADDAANVANVYDKDGAELTSKAAASQFVTLDPSLLAGARYVKVRSGAAASAVTQTANRKITLSIRTV